VLKFWNIVRPGRERPARSAIAFGLVFAFVVGLGSYWDLRQSDAGPRETATVVDRQRVEGRAFCPSGGRGTDPRWDVTWRSENPPAGLPAEFTEKAVCNWNAVSDEAEIIRVTESGRTKVYQDVVRSGRESLSFAGWTFVILGVFALPVFWGQFAVARWWRRRRDERAAQTNVS